MTTALDVACEHSRLLINGEPVSLHIQENVLEGEGNAVLVSLEADLQSELKWDSALTLAEQAVERGLFVLWELDFRLGDGEISLYDPMPFQAYGVAIDHFVKEVWERFKEKSIGVVLFRGSSSFEKQFPNDAAALESYEEWVATMPQQTDGHLPLFYATIFADYLHRLVSCLPDSIQAFCLLDAAKATSSAQLAQLLSKERFEHVHFGLMGSSLPLAVFRWQGGMWCSMKDELPAKIGICLPADALLTASLVRKLDDILQELQECNQPLRILAESRLSQEWDGIDQLIILSEAVSPQGKRLLQGFSAAGGSIIVCGKPLGFLEEIAYQLFMEELRRVSLVEK